MNEGAPVMYHGNSFGNRQYPLEVLQYLGGRAGPALRDRPPPPQQPHKDCAFGYESDDSSLSSNASGSNKSSEKGESSSRTSEHGSTGYASAPGGGGGGGVRAWRGRARRDQRPRRIAPERYLNASYPFQVKFTPDDLLNGSQWDTLSQEIWDKFVKSQQTEEMFRKKMNLWKYLYITIKSIFPRYGLYVVGSTMSGFGLDSSDMDLCLFVRAAGAAEPRGHALAHLAVVLDYVRALDPNAELIQAKVPIVKFGDRQGLRVDLNCNNVVGIRNTNLLYCYSRLDWRVRPLAVLLKLWAAAHRINNARDRTLSSYSLTLMVIQFLQCGVSPPVLPCVSRAAAPRAPNRQPLGELFAALLRYYAHFPYDKMAVSVRAGRPLPVAECRAARSHKNDPHQWKLLCVEEPFDLTNTARSVYDPETFDVIVNTFRASHARLAASPRLAAAWPRPEHPDLPEHPEHPERR